MRHDLIGSWVIVFLCKIVLYFESLRIPINLFDISYQETYQKFKANPPARIKRKAEKQRQEREADEKRRRLNDERAAQVIKKWLFVLVLFFYLTTGTRISPVDPDVFIRIRVGE